MQFTYQDSLETITNQYIGTTMATLIPPAMPQYKIAVYGITAANHTVAAGTIQGYIMQTAPSTLYAVNTGSLLEPLSLQSGNTFSDSQQDRPLFTASPGVAITGITNTGSLAVRISYRYILGRQG